MLSTQVINMNPQNPTIRRITKLQLMWKARYQAALTMQLQRLGIMMAINFFGAAEWTRWRDFRNHRWWAHQSLDTGTWFYEDLMWTAVQGKRSDGQLEHPAWLFQEASGACMPLWKLLSITAQDMTQLIIHEQYEDYIILRAKHPGAESA